jgi:hypothetical protein
MILKPVSLIRSLVGLAPLLIDAPSLATTGMPAPPISCEVAVPSECETTVSLAAKVAQRQRVVKSLAATSEAECLNRAREMTTACVRSSGSGAEITAKFRNGPVSTLVQVSPSAPRPPQLGRALTSPIVYGKNFETEFEQFGYNPRFAPGVVNFNADGSIQIRYRNYLETQMKDGRWAYKDLAAAAAEAIRALPNVESFDWVWDNRSAFTDQRIYFDAGGRAYTVVQGGRTRLKDAKSISYRPYLLATRDNGISWRATALAVPDERSTWRARIEYNDGNNDRSLPPPLLLYDREDDATKRSAKLYLYVPQWEKSELTVPAAVLVSEQSLLTENHSGAANSLVSTLDKIYVFYPGSIAQTQARGTPEYMVVFDKQKGAIESEALIGFGGAAAKADNHNIPGACIGTGKLLHVLLPGHQEAMRLRTGSIDATGVRWAPDEAIGEPATSAGGYTYGSLNCDRAGNVYITSRWAGDHYRFELVFLHRQPGGTWTTWGGKRHKVIVDPGRSFYGLWHQHVTLDAKGALFLSYAYYANQLTEEEFSNLKWRFPFHEWTVVKELQPRFCVKNTERCWLHPMPDVTDVLMKSENRGMSWALIQ